MMGKKKKFKSYLILAVLSSSIASLGVSATTDVQVYPGFIFKGTDDKLSSDNASYGYIYGYVRNHDDNKDAMLVAAIERRKSNSYKLDIEIDVYNPWDGAQT